MAKFAKILAMIVRVLFIVEIVLGVLLTMARLQFLNAHIGLGFLVALCVGLLAIVAGFRVLLALLESPSRYMGGLLALALVGLVFAILLPVTGLKQFPLKFGSGMGLIQIVHVVVALAAVGMAEALHARIRKAA